MSRSTSTRTPDQTRTPEQLEAALRDALAALQNDPDVVTAQERHDLAARAAAAANEALQACQAALHTVEVRIARPDLVDDLERFERLLATRQAALTEYERQKPAPGSGLQQQWTTRRAHLQESRDATSRGVDEKRQEIAGAKAHPIPEPQILAAPTELRRAYRQAVKDCDAARAAAQATREPLLDAAADLRTAKAAARSRVRARLVEIATQQVHHFGDALAAAKVQNDRLAAMIGRVNGALAEEALSPLLCWPQFADNASGSSRYQTWRDSLAVNAPAG